MKMTCLQETRKYQTLQSSITLPSLSRSIAALFVFVSVSAHPCASSSPLTPSDPAPNPSNYPTTLSTTPWPNTLT